MEFPLILPDAPEIGLLAPKLLTSVPAVSVLTTTSIRVVVNTIRDVVSLLARRRFTNLRSVGY